MYINRIIENNEKTKQRNMNNKELTITIILSVWPHEKSSNNNILRSRNKPDQTTSKNLGMYYVHPRSRS